MLKVKVDGERTEIYTNGPSDMIIAEMLLGLNACYLRLHEEDREIFLDTLAQFTEEILPVADDCADKKECECKGKKDSTDELIEKAGELIGALESVLEELNKK